MKVYTVKVWCYEGVYGQVHVLSWCIQSRCGVMKVYVVDVWGYEGVYGEGVVL